jgi:glutaredoxin-related protein
MNRITFAPNILLILMKTRLTVNLKCLMHFVVVCFFALALCCCSSCARVYHSLSPDKMTYTETDVKDSVIFSYKYQILRNKYFNKETRKDIKLIAVKCTNHSGRDIVFGSDIQLMRESGRAADLAGNSYIYDKLRQKSASHLWWMLFSFLTVSFTENSGYSQPHTTTVPVGLLLAPVLTTVNITTAASANRTFNNDLKKYNLLGTTIRKGETVYGLAGVRTYKYEKLSLKDSASR